MSQTDRASLPAGTDRLDVASQHGAPAITDILSGMAERVDHSTQRHDEVLAEVHSRLEGLGRDADGARQAIPAEFVPELERIQDGMTQLAKRIAEASRLRATAHDDAPAPLRSGASLAPQSRISAAPARPAIDPFDVIDHDAATEPWDARSADLLARHYHGEPDAAGANPTGQSLMLSGSGQADLFRVTVAALASPVASIATAPPELAQYAPVKRAEPTSERSWLEARFGEIAGLIAKAHAVPHANTAIEALKDRFDLLESRFGAALEGVATRTDVEGLRVVEAHVLELGQKFEQAEAQLRSLSAIESDLHQLVERLPAERIATLFAATARSIGDNHELANADLEHFAQLAGDMAAERFASTHADRDQHDGAHGLRHIIEGFINERRLGDEHTASVLETMQQAMIRVLDRIDAMEEVQYTGAAAPGRQAPHYATGHGGMDAHYHDQTQEMAGLTEALSEPTHEPLARGEPAAGELRGPARMDGAENARAVRSPGREDSPASPYTPASPLAPPSPFEHVPSDTAWPAAAASFATAATAAATPSPQPAGVRPSEINRNDFIASARRAQRLASSVTTDATAAASGPRPAIVTATLTKIKRDNPATLIGSLLARFSRGEPAVTGAAAVCLGLIVSGFVVAQLAGGKAGNASVATRSAVMEQPERAVPGRGPAVIDDGRSSITDDTGQTIVEPVLRSADTGAASPGSEATRPASTGLSGIAVQKSSVRPDDVLRLREQQQMASLSSQIGEAAARAEPSVLLGANASAGLPTGAVGATGAVTSLDLPPATVGPLSLRIAAAKGDPSAEFEVAARLAEGKGTDQNFVEALRWYNRSAARGFVQAQYRLATLYERGLGTKQDVGKARSWYKRAADQGNVKAMHNLAVLSAGRQSGAPDYTTAAQYFAQAAERGLADSQFNLAVLYESGLGLNQDNVQAFKWYTLAARSGDKDTERRRLALKVQMRPADVLAAEELARAFAPTPMVPLANDARFAGEQWKAKPAQASAPGPLTIPAPGLLNLAADAKG